MSEIRTSDVPTESPYKISEHIYELCCSSDSVSSILAQDPCSSPGEAWKKAFGHHGHTPKSPNGDIRDIGKGVIDLQEIERTRNCGKWGTQEPCDLFVRMYHDALCTLNDDLASGMVSPSLLGSSGTMPLTITSVVPDIVRHMSNLIVRAEKEVFLATNFWQNGVASKYITNAIKELSRRAGEREVKIVMKIIYDRGSPKQLLEPHYTVPESEYTGKAVALPASHEIPNIDLQVINYHRPLLGTFHAKYMIVDRKIAVLQSNNIQDNDNLEMMVQLEGPIVDSMYDMALISWHKKLEPPLPYLDCPAAMSGSGSFDASHAAIFGPEGAVKSHVAVVDPDKLPKRNGEGLEVLERKQSWEVVNHNGTADPSSSNGEIIESNGSHGRVTSADHDSEITHSVISPETLPEHTAEDPHYDVDLAGEIQRVQASISLKPGETPMRAVTRHLNHTVNEGFEGNAPDCDPRDEMTPYVPHPAHEPFPMALVCRPPYGPPNHASVSNPQNAAWLSALRNAQKNVFIQSPTLNAEPLIPAIVEACERGVDVYCYVCLGYNDSGEMLPMQGGHNESIAHNLYTKLLSPDAKPRLHWYWYVAKDQTAPITATKKRRSCHIKLLIADERVGIVGNGNQDTQSWFHSQEINVMIDSPLVCGAWIEALRRNQNTHLYGRVGEDGVWRDSQGKEADGATGVDAGRFSWAKGLLGAIKRVQGTGGF
ncbi:IQ calmodulin-binding motif protein [Annulohypoxylon maeteangense]|uniref:IQ calmodulin-binding motif protein n=1 Tax=Annulohypoxylon maeteangense TaxID=1927788 RepID=UPI00200829B2|nr:IQ calmodulin-binding motif protein [Annulohypoxylon maeteangense]KAI0890297.1 IQ calmodulin-binding motif protein [Annulohypoxylon maeteangense]